MVPGLARSVDDREYLGLAGCYSPLLSAMIFKVLPYVENCMARFWIGAAATAECSQAESFCWVGYTTCSNGPLICLRAAGSIGVDSALGLLFRPDPPFSVAELTQVQGESFYGVRRQPKHTPNGHCPDRDGAKSSEARKTPTRHAPAEMAGRAQLL
jgi:hypothetical protein